MEDSERSNSNLAKNRSRNYANEGNSGLYEGGKTRFHNQIRQNNFQEKRDLRANNQNNSKYNIGTLDDMKISNIIYFIGVNINNKNEKSQSSRNTNKHNHSYHEIYYSNGINQKLDNIELKLNNFQNDISKVLTILNNISNSMKIFISKQDELIQLTKKIII